MRAAADLQGPVGYSPWWTALAAAAVLVTVAYFVAVLWWTRAPRVRRDRAASPDRARRACLRRLDEIVSQVRSGAIPATEGHQRVSEAVRRFVESAGGPRATSMTLEGLRGSAPEPLTRLVEELYPAAFAGDERTATAHLHESVGRARDVVTSWT